MQYETLSRHVCRAGGHGHAESPGRAQRFQRNDDRGSDGGVSRRSNERDDVRAVVLAANGKAFCAGADLNWMKKMAGYSDEENRADAMLLAAHAVGDLPLQQAGDRARQWRRVRGRHGADLRRATSWWRWIRARFCLSEARLGLIPATIAPYVIRALGEQASRRYFTTAELFDCATALRLGLVSEVGQRRPARCDRAADCRNAVRQWPACGARVQAARAGYRGP